jgi:hypothetical protein
LADEGSAAEISTRRKAFGCIKGASRDRRGVQIAGNNAAFLGFQRSACMAWSSQRQQTSTCRNCGDSFGLHPGMRHAKA